MYKLFFADVNPYYDEKAYEKGYAEVGEYFRQKADAARDSRNKSKIVVAGLLFREMCENNGLLSIEDTIKADADGKVYFDCSDEVFPGRTRIHFNLAYAHDMVMLGICDTEIGVALEYADSVDDNIASKYFTEDEEDMYFKAGDEEYKLVFNKIAALKKSYVKYIGKPDTTGLSKMSVLNHLQDCGVRDDKYVYAVTVTDYKEEATILDIDTAKPKTNKELLMSRKEDSGTIKPRSNEELRMAHEADQYMTPEPAVLDTKKLDQLNCGKQPLKRVKKLLRQVPEVQPADFEIVRTSALVKELNVRRSKRFRNKTSMLVR